MDIYSDLLKNIAGVNKYSTSLNKLSERWDLLTLMGQMSNIGMDMTNTRDAFQQLTDGLMQKLTEETVKKTTDEFASMAQVAVDIVIRNLFERTADIGFLATDDDIRSFVKYIKEGTFDTDDLREERREARENISKRFRDYVAKYSVYSDIILLDCDGRVLAKLDESNPVKKSSDPIIEEAINTSAEYVETYRVTDLTVEQIPSLIYAYRVTEDSSPNSKVLGVLALVFRFRNEMEGIFENLKSEEDWFEITILDKDGRVIASSDEYHIPIGAKMSMELEKPFRIVRFAGREYIVKTCATNGYQDFYGLGWYGHVLAPLDKAFEEVAQKSYQVDEKVLEAVMKTSNLFPDELKTIPQKAERIQKELNSTVWNGNVQIANTKSGDNTFSKSLLNEISKTGDSTKRIFEESIANLNTTVIGSILDNVEFQAELAIDIMDRNLYERANDCRWWALTTYFRKHLGEDIDSEVANHIESILIYINNLYTVYTNLIVYDTNGVIIAVSNPEERGKVGKKISASWVQETLNITDQQKYSVSRFEKTEYYKSAHTYIYGAPIMDYKEPQKCVGGIGIVFDSLPEFEAMLKDALPKDAAGEIVEGCFALFANRDKSIIASSSSRFKVGSSIEIEGKFFSQANGQGYSTIITYEGNYYIVGSSTSKGYREYKTKDGYVQDIVSLVFIHIGKVYEEASKEIKSAKEYSYPSVQGNEETEDISTFYIYDRVYGIQSSNVICSITGQEITPILGSDENYLGVINYMGSTVPVVTLKNMMGYAGDEDKAYNPETDTIILAKVDNLKLGIIASRVKDSPSIPKRSIEPSAGLGATITGAVVKPEAGDVKKEMLSILNIKAIISHLVGKQPNSSQLMIDKQ
ncbi:MAG: chemotaxis protein CheW [Campylobacterales bacterium]